MIELDSKENDHKTRSHAREKKKKKGKGSEALFSMSSQNTKSSQEGVKLQTNYVNQLVAWWASIENAEDSSSESRSAESSEIKRNNRMALNPSLIQRTRFNWIQVNRRRPVELTTCNKPYVSFLPSRVKAMFPLMKRFLQAETCSQAGINAMHRDTQGGLVSE